MLEIQKISGLYTGEFTEVSANDHLHYVPVIDSFP